MASVEMLRSLEKSKGNGQGANNMSRKMGRDSRTANGGQMMCQICNDDLLTIPEQGPTKGKSDQVKYHPRLLKGFWPVGTKFSL